MSSRSLFDKALTMSKLLDWKKRAETAEQTIKDISGLPTYAVAEFSTDTNTYKLCKTEYGGLVKHDELQAILNRSKT